MKQQIEFTTIFSLFLLLLFFFSTAGTATAKNADLSYWSKNLSEPTLAEETGLKDHNADIENFRLDRSCHVVDRYTPF